MILASTSPRRQQLLRHITETFTIVDPAVDETVDQNLSPEQVVEILSARKAKAVAEHHPDEMVLGADTVVAWQGKILGKPLDEQEAFDTLKRLSAQTHRVLTGVTLQKGSFFHTFVTESTVTFYPLTDEEIADYIATGEPMDKAGSYGIQGKGGLFVKEIHGDYFNIVGLPIAGIYRVLCEQKIDII